MAKASTSAPLAVRCAIYTRKSSEEGLEQDFNSLHAQREACEAYVRSQVGEGWRLLPDLYDDGGFSGGNLERPGLKRLLTDIDHGKIDIVVVYKVDRLTRSLSDFAKIVDRFDAKGASFVSVTQSFNTTTSMGRLTLNMLLSFAQFEREVTGERIRDKIAASKRKGMWMGGNLPLGYDASGRTLAINAPEAEQVREIFRRYLEVKSVHRLAEQLAADGVVSKRRVAVSSGRASGGQPIGRGALFHLLSNRVYRGQIPHKQEWHPGLHLPIVDQTTFEAAQLLLAEGRGIRRAPSLRRQSSPLMGKLFDADGQPMSPTISYGKGGRSYRYYVSTSLQTGARAAPHDGLKRLAGAEIEGYLAEQVRRLLDLAPGEPENEVLHRLQRVQVRSETVTLILPMGEQRQYSAIALKGHLQEGEELWASEDGASVCIAIPVRVKFRAGRSWQRLGQGGSRRVVPRPDQTLINGLKRAHAIMNRLGASPLLAPDQMRNSAVPVSQYERQLVQLVFLAPHLQRAILEGVHPPALSLQALIDLEVPFDWIEQQEFLVATPR